VIFDEERGTITFIMLVDRRRHCWFQRITREWVRNHWKKLGCGYF